MVWKGLGRMKRLLATMVVIAGLAGAVGSFHFTRDIPPGPAPAPGPGPEPPIVKVVI